MLQALGEQSVGLWIGPKMANVLTDPWRTRVLMELSGRPMSPSQFVDSVGGDLVHISRCFRQLAEMGYAEIAIERPGKRRGASIEHVYRSIRRAHFDTATWEGLPRFQRDLVSDSILGSYFHRVSEAVKAGTFDQELDRHLSWDGVALDRTAWEALGAELDAVLDWLSCLETESIARRDLPGSEDIPTVVGMAAFRSPQSAEILWKAPRRDLKPLEPGMTPSGKPITVEMAKAMRNRWRSRILMELNARPLSQSRFIEEIGGSPSHISRCFRQLEEWGYIEVVEVRPGGRRGGGVERVYRNTQRAYFSTEEWSELPPILRSEFSTSILGSYLARITEAIKAGTFDAEKDRHLSWMPISLDRPAWTELSLRLDEVLEWLPKLEKESLARQGKDPDRLIPTTVGLASFRMPG
jgi:DNA-binding transcriptional ArsR family regulator